MLGVVHVQRFQNVIYPKSQVGEPDNLLDRSPALNFQQEAAHSRQKSKSAAIHARKCCKVFLRWRACRYFMERQAVSFLGKIFDTSSNSSFPGKVECTGAAIALVQVSGAGRMR